MIIETDLRFKRQLKDRVSTKLIVLHHSASTAGNVGAAEIHRWHQDRGWNGIGYHYVIRRSGDVERGRPVQAQGAHVRGQNAESIGICLTGDFRIQGPSPQQIRSAQRLLRELMRAFPQAEIVRHSDLANTACPGHLLHLEILVPKPPMPEKVESEKATKAPPVGIEQEGKHGFDDLEGHWVEPDIAFLVSRGLLARGQQFRPADLATRAELAALCARVVRYFEAEVQRRNS